MCKSEIQPDISPEEYVLNCNFLKGHAMLHYIHEHGLGQYEVLSGDASDELNHLPCARANFCC